MHNTNSFTGSYPRPTITKSTKTTVREFDQDERCIKETVTEVTETQHQQSWNNPVYYGNHLIKSATTS